jgi:transcriptional regulator with XRE-family HTH domain
MKTVRELREAKGLSPVEVAAALNVSLATVYNWESDKHEPRASQLRDLARLFGVRMDDVKIPGVHEDGPGSDAGTAENASPLRRK